MKIHQNRSAYATKSDLVLALSCIEQRPIPLVDEAFRQSLVQAETAIRLASTNLEQAKIAKDKAANERLRLGKVLVKTVRDFYQGLNRAVARTASAEPWKELYACQTNLPKSDTLTSEWYEQARLIAATSASSKAKLALEAGAPAVTNPSAEEVAATLPDAVAADEAWRAAILTLKQSQEAHRLARREGQRLLVGLRLRLRAMAQDLPLAARHNLMHAYGIRLRAERAEQTAPDPTRDPANAPAVDTAREPIPA